MTRNATLSPLFAATILGLVAAALCQRRMTRQAICAAGPDECRPVRNAGPEEMRDPPASWSRVDELSDESFPASDPPGTY